MRQSHGDSAWPRNLESICDQFEREWKANPALRVEVFQKRLPSEAFADVASELIALEIELRENNGEKLDRGEYHRRFPENRPAVDDAFSRTFVELVRVSQAEVGSHSDNLPVVLLPEGMKGVPRRIGPYKVGRFIGSGSFGMVYLGIESQTGKQFALKFPCKQNIMYQSELDAFLDEAAAAIDLDHPGIIKTFDVVLDGDWVAIVQQFIDGVTLSEIIRKGVTQLQCAELIAQIAEAASYAHMRGLVHRDIKPANILVDRNGNPYLGDFGLAVHENVQRYLKGTRAGTLAYMSPEMVEGQVNFLDGRSDIWSIGVIMYQMLVPRQKIGGLEKLRHPFEGDTAAEVIDEIRHKPVKPPRQIDNTIDPELERICLNCLQKPVRDRYLTGSDLANELRAWLSDPLGKQPLRKEKVIPAGLRPFGPDDKDFFLQLLPGPRNSRGIPASILFWKSRIESTSPETTFPIGLIYGPSGSGKSSFVQAGLLPRLPSFVLPCYVEATAADTEIRLRKRLRQSFPEIPSDVDLPNLLLGLREGLWASPGKKILIILDQFEQWLFANRFDAASELVRALRHCDGKRLQALITVRDDFWIAVSRFMSLLEVELVDGHNAQMVDLFDTDHARNVLIEFGRAYERLFCDSSDLTTDQEHFLDLAIDGLAVDGRVICVHLALFAELFKNRPWTVAGLRSVGGISGVGEKFLEETFNERTAEARLKPHKQAVIKILGALLPDSGTDIKGAMQSTETLMHACGYEARSVQFQQLIDYLNKELRILTPTDPDASGHFPSTGRDSRLASHYQLAHDYLVPAISKWIARGKSETWRGRAELRLVELENLWKRRQDRQFLPGPLETLQITSAVPKARRSKEAAELIHRAQVYYGFRAATIVAVVAVFVALSVAAMYTYYAPRNAVRFLATAEASQVPGAIAQVAKWRLFVADELADLLANSNSQYRLHAAYASLELNPEFDLAAAQIVADAIATEATSIDEFDNVTTALGKQSQSALDVLKSQFEALSSYTAQVRLAVTALYLGDSELLQLVCANEERPDLRTALVHALPDWHGNLHTIAQLIESTEDKSLKYAVVLSLGLIDPRQLEFAERSRCASALQGAFLSDPDGGVHSACMWTLKRWGIEIPALPSIDVPPDNRDWWTKQMPDGSLLTFVRVGPGEFLRGEGTDAVSDKDPSRGWQPQELVEIPYTYWVCTTETPYSLVRQWIQQLDPADPARQNVERDPLWPDAGGLPFFFAEGSNSWTDKEVGVFMNWLNSLGSQQSDPIYTESDGKLVLDEKLGGFRMPSFDEFEFAARGNTKSPFFWGSNDSPALVAHYVAFNPRSTVTNSIDVIASGTKMPNRYGIHDTAGNVAEFCFDNDHFFQSRGMYIVRGFTAADSVDRFYSGFRGLPAAPGYFGYEGIRLVYLNSTDLNVQ